MTDTEDTASTPGTITVDGLKISPTFTKVPDSLLTAGTLALSDSLLMKQISNAMASSEEVPSTDGWTNHFLTVFKMAGKGKYGNNYGVYLQLDQTREEDLEDSRRYFYSVFKKDSTGNTAQQVSQRSLSFNPSAVDTTGTVSEFIDTVVKSDDYVKEFTGLKVYTNETVYEELINLFGNYTGAVASTAKTICKSF